MLPCKTCIVLARCKSRFEDTGFHVVNNCSIICKFLISHSKKVVNKFGKYGYEFLLNESVAEDLYQIFYGDAYVAGGGWGNDGKGDGKYTSTLNNKQFRIGYMQTWKGVLEEFEK